MYEAKQRCTLRMDGSGTRKALPRIGRPTTWNKKARKLFLCVRRPLAHRFRETCLDRPGVPEIGAISTTVWVNSPMNEKKQPADYRDGDQCCSRDLRFLRDWSPHNMDHHDGEPSVRPERFLRLNQVAEAVPVAVGLATTEYT